jgi:hypothetical protein
MQGGRSDEEVLQEGTKALCENNEERRTDPVFDDVGERSGISGISASPSIISWEMTKAFR